MLGALCPNTLFLLDDRTRRCKVAIDLAVQILAIRDDEECPVAGDFSENLQGEEDHGIAFAGALRVPEDAELPLVGLDLLGRRDRLVYSEVLMVLRYQLRG